MKSFDIIVFDLDDTMYPRKQYIHSGCEAVGRYLRRVYGIDCMTELKTACMAGSVADGITSTLKKHFNHVEDSLVVRLLHVFRCHRPLIQPFPETLICLALFRNQGTKLAMISSDLPDVQTRKMAALNIQDLLDTAFYGRDNDGNDTMKDAFRLLELLSDGPLSRVAFVGNDTTSDFETPRSLGVTTVCVSRSVPGKNANIMISPRSDITINSLIDLPAELARMNNLQKAS